MPCRATASSATTPGPKDGWQNRAGVNIWNMITVDDKRGIAYLPFTGPAPDRWGGDRHGTNLFGNTLVAVDANTGKRLWHFQLLHHEVWDWDQPTPPMLFDVKKDGKTIPAVAAMNKSGYLFILDRVTGKPLYDVKEVPVPKSNVDGRRDLADPADSGDAAAAGQAELHRRHRRDQHHAGAGKPSARS